jgi:hypothetical protein
MLGANLGQHYVPFTQMSTGQDGSFHVLSVQAPRKALPTSGK